MEEKNYGAFVAVLGLIIGLTFGILVMMSGTWSAVAVLAFGVGGAVLSYVVYSAVAGTLDFAGAWRALRRRA